MEQGVVEALLGARGAAREVGVDLGLQPSSLNEVWLQDSVTFTAEEVVAVDSQLEDEDDDAGFEDVEAEDNVDDPVHDDADYDPLVEREGGR